jgi:predicted site-specific integrase-resolvase
MCCLAFFSLFISPSAATFQLLQSMLELHQHGGVYFLASRILAHRDRLVRFGHDYFEAFCQRQHTEELVRDLRAIVIVFSARLHGLRSNRNVLKDAALQKE